MNRDRIWKKKKLLVKPVQYLFNFCCGKSHVCCNSFLKNNKDFFFKKVGSIHFSLNVTCRWFRAAHSKIYSELNFKLILNGVLWECIKFCRFGMSKYLWLGVVTCHSIFSPLFHCRGLHQGGTMAQCFQSFQCFSFYFLQYSYCKKIIFFKHYFTSIWLQLVFMFFYSFIRL